MAADSRATVEGDDGGTSVTKCSKLFRKKVGKKEVIIGTAGETGPGLIFLDWYGSGKDAPLKLIDGDADFTCLVLTNEGLFEYDKWCRGEEVLDKFYAIGSGRKAAMGAMHAGAEAKHAVQIACLVDPFTAPPVVSMSLEHKTQKVKK